MKILHLHFKIYRRMLSLQWRTSEAFKKKNPNEGAKDHWVFAFAPKLCWYDGKCIMLLHALSIEWSRYTEASILYAHATHFTSVRPKFNNLPKVTRWRLRASKIFTCWVILIDWDVFFQYSLCYLMPNLWKCEGFIWFNLFTLYH